jgi:protein involved in polysaccharide export with SLBB domain/beta-lactamase regulating signal transducer with metallopeptidase domain
MPWYVAMYEMLLQVSLAGCVLLAVATVAVVLLREPARQIRVIELAMWGLLALPLVVLIPGYPRVALLPASEEPTPRASLVQPPASPGGSTLIDFTLPSPAELAPPRATTPPRTLTPPRTSTPPLAPTPPPISTRPRTDIIVSRARESSAAPLPAPAWQLPTDYRLWIASTYLAGAGVLLAWSLVGFVALRRLVRSSQPADAAARSALQAIAGDASARARLLVSPRAAQPCAFRWIRPTIVLPQALIDSADPAALRFALAHEWSHVSRGDVGVWTISGFARLLHFQQPLVWFLRQHLRRAQDYLADAAAAGAGTPEDYAEFLTSFSQSFKRPRLAPGLGIVSRRSDLHRRVVMLVEKQGSLERTPPRRWNVAILIAGLLAVAAVASLRAEPQQAAEQQPLSSATPDLEKPTPDGNTSLSGELKNELDVLIQRDPTIVRLQQQLEQNENERDRLASDPNPTPDKLAALDKQGQQILLIAERIRARASELGVEIVQLAQDPHIQKLTQEKESLELAMRQSVVNGGTYNSAADNKAAYERVAQLRREIGRVEEQIGERKAKIRETVTESQQSTPARAQYRQAQQFVLDELLDAMIALDPKIGQLNQELAAIRQQVVGLRGDPVRDVEWQQRANELTAEHERKIRALKEATDKRRAELRDAMRPRLAEAQTQRFMLGDDGLAQNQPTTATRSAPFSGKIRPGDILQIEIEGGLPQSRNPPRTVEPDGNVVIGAVYGDLSRMQVGGMTLIEAGKHIEAKVREVLREPHVLVTYVGHDPDVISAAEAAKSARAPIPIAWEAEAELEPLDTIELELPVKGHMVRQLVDGKLREVLTTIPDINDVYVIEPDGNIALPFRYGRVNIKGLTEKDAGNAIRKHLTEKWMPRTALPQVSVRKRGRAVFPPDQQPPADGRIRPGDSLLIGNRLQRDAFNYQVSADGNLPAKEISFLGGASDQGSVPPLHVAGLSLAEAQDAIAKSRKSDAIIVTIGGWHEQADPASGFTSELTTVVRALDSKPVALEPLDTIQIRLGAKTQTLDSLNGTYLIEPDGRVGLAGDLGRIKLAGLTETQAGEAVRAHISTQPGQRKAPPSINIVRRGRAVFPEGKQPAADYRVQAGDRLLVNQGFSAADGGSYEVTTDGMFQTQPEVIEPKQEPVHVAGLTLEEVQNTLREKWKFLAFRGTGVRQLGFPNPVWMVTLGGWHEEADPQLIDRLGESSDPRVQQLERELQQIKTLLREHR